MSRNRRPFDIVHIAQTQFPDDARPRREALVGAEMGARVAVIALQDGLDRRPVGHYGGVAIVRLPGERRRGSVGKYVQEYTDFLRRAQALLRRDPRFGQARVIHVHTLPDFLIAAAAPARRNGARVILDMHEIFPEFARTKFGGVLGRIAEPAGRVVERWSRRRADVVLTVNRAVEKLLRSRADRADERIVVIHNLTDPADFGPEGLTTGIVAGPLRLAYHGTITRLYGLDLAVAAIAEARSRGTDVEYDIYGRGPDAEPLSRQIESLGAERWVRLMGSVSHAALRQALPTYHAGFLPTRLDGMTRYSLSTKLLEYVHLGVPLIAPRIPTYLDYFPEGTAWYFTPNDPADAARAIVEFAHAAPDERIARASRAQRSIAELTWAKEAKKLRDIYAELLGD